MRSCHITKVILCNIYVMPCHVVSCCSALSCHVLSDHVALHHTIQLHSIDWKKNVIWLASSVKLLNFYIKKTLTSILTTWILTMMLDAWKSRFKLLLIFFYFKNGEGNSSVAKFVNMFMRGKLSDYLMSLTEFIMPLQTLVFKRWNSSLCGWKEEK